MLPCVRVLVLSVSINSRFFSFAAGLLCVWRTSTRQLTGRNYHRNQECAVCSCIQCLPYSGKLSREKTFVNFVVLWLYAKVFSTKFGTWRPLALQKRAIRETFLHKNHISTNSQKFSPSKVSRYMVCDTIL